MPLYVICRNHGYEGYTPPLLVARSREEGEAALAFMSVNDSSMELFEVPEWPAPPNSIYGTKPIQGG
jgi:hypothetical protein